MVMSPLRYLYYMIGSIVTIVRAVVTNVNPMTFFRGCTMRVSVFMVREGAKASLTIRFSCLYLYANTSSHFYSRNAISKVCERMGRLAILAFRYKYSANRVTSVVTYVSRIVSARVGSGNSQFKAFYFISLFCGLYVSYVPRPTRTLS